MNPTRRRAAAVPRPEGGFTMMEVLIALAILLLGIAGLLSMQMSAMRATSFSRHATEASMLAEDKMEALRTVATASITCPSVAACTETVDARGNLDADGPYTRVWTPSTLGGETLLTVVVSWNEQGGDPHNITMTTVRQ